MSIVNDGLNFSSDNHRWMISQDDILITNKMPLIKPTLHPLDRNSKWNKVFLELEKK